ncbi:MAG: hypothetical protein NVSMB51_12900 [Solirubrobacteraceae bacterium]
MLEHALSRVDAPLESIRARYRRGGAAKRLRVRRIGLALYGLGFAGIVCVSNHVPAVTLLGTRQAEVHWTLSVLRAGGPPLWANVGGQNFPLDGPDHGAALYLSLLGQLFNQSDPNVLMGWFFLAALGVSFALYPLVFSELFDSRVIGIAAPLLLLPEFALIRFADIYWLYAWSVLTALPLVMLAYRRWGGNRAIVLLLGALFVASFANSVRNGSGLPILFSALILLLLVDGSRQHRLGVGLVCLLAYLSLTPGIFSVVRAYRDGEVRSSPRWHSNVIYPPVGTTGGFWHTAYIGLAYVPNRYGINTFKDVVPANYVASVDPKAQFLSPRYEKVLRDRIIYLVEHDPGFVLKAVGEKAIVVADDGLSAYPLLLVLLPPLLLVARRRRLVAVDVLLTVPALFIFFCAPVVSIPTGRDRLTGYELGWYAALAFLWMVTLIWVIRWVLDQEPAIRRRLGFDGRDAAGGHPGATP